MKKFISPLLIATHIGATTPQLSSAKEFKSDSIARRMLIEDAVDGKLEIKTVEKAYPYAKSGGDLERAMWLALMKDPALLEDYMGQGMRREVKVVYPDGLLKTIGNGLYCITVLGGFIVATFLLGRMEHQPNNQIIINTNEK